MTGVTRRDRIQNAEMRQRTDVTESIIEDIKNKNRRLLRFGHELNGNREIRPTSNSSLLSC